MRKKHLQLLLTAVLAGTTVSTTASGIALVQAADPGTTEDTTTASSLQDLVANVKDGETIVLSQDCTLDEAIEIENGKNITLDLHGHTISIATGYAISVKNGGTLTIEDSSANKGGTVKSNDTDGASYPIRNEGQLTINSGTITGTGYSIFTGNPTEHNNTEPIKTTINGGTLTGLGTNGLQNNVAIEVNDGTFTSHCLFTSGGDTTYTINGGTFDCSDDTSSKSCINVKAGTLNITGGNFINNKPTNSNEKAATSNNGQDGFVGAIVISKPDGANADTAYAGDLQVNIKGGTFTNSSGDSIVVAHYKSNGDSDSQNGIGINLNISDADVTGNVAYYSPEGTSNHPAEIAITGGHFTSDPALLQVNENAAVVTNLPVASTGSEGSKTFYVAAARISQAMQAGEQTDFTITQGNLDLSGVQPGIKIKNDGTGTVKVNGHTITEGNEMTTTRPSTSGGSSGSSGGSSSVDKVTSVSMHRLYNPNSGEHFYTKEAAEKNHLVSLGWQAEGVGWTAPSTSTQPVYRLYNPNAGDHHYTMNAAEQKHLISLGWKDEGIGWYSDEAKTIPLYREYNPNAKAGSHNYTTSQAEHNHLISVGWNDEGIAWYGVK